MAEGKTIGTIEWHRDRWRVRITTPDGRRRSFSCKLGEPREAAEVLRAALLEQLAGTTDDPAMRGQTLGAWFVKFIAMRELTHRDAEGDRQRWSYLAGTTLASTRLDALTPSNVLGWARDLVRREARDGGYVSRRTARNVWNTFRACIHAAVEAERMTPDRAAAILALRLPTSPIEAAVEMDERIEWLRAPEVERVLALPLTPEQRSAFVVGVYAALRAGELHGLAWERIDWEERSLVVARSRGEATKQGKVGRVPLLGPAYDALRTRWEEAGKPASGLVWPAEGGGCHARGYDWGWADHPSKTFFKFGLRRLARIPRDVTWNDATRHTGAVHLLRGTWAPDVVPRAYRMEEVSRFLRHSSLRTTENHYAALTLDALPVTATIVQPIAPAATAEASPPESVPPRPRGGIGVLAAVTQEPVSMPDSGSRLGDLNSGPTVYETVALPLS